MPLVISKYKFDKIYNMGETILFCKAQSNKTFVQDKVRLKFSKRLSVPCKLTANCTRTHKLKLVVVYKSMKPGCFRKWQLLVGEYMLYYTNAIAWMNGDMF